VSERRDWRPIDECDVPEGTHVILRDSDKHEWEVISRNGWWERVDDSLDHEGYGWACQWSPVASARGVG
jgi:hypothetical protein